MTKLNQNKRAVAHLLHMERRQCGTCGNRRLSLSLTALFKVTRIMIIKREDLDAGRVDLDLSGEAIPLSSPGDILGGEFLEPMKITPYRLARDIGVPPNRITAILSGSRGISADTALRLGRYFGMSAAFWANLQSDYDLRIAEETQGSEIIRNVRVRGIA